MKRMLFNATQAEELRVAIVDGQTLLDLDIETLGKEQRKGNIYKGVITRIEPSLEACFVDYGTDRHGFLPFKEVSRSYFQDYDGGRARIQDVLKEGMQVIVQVEKDERGNKGAALTTFISLAGRYLVLMPNNPRGGGVSRRIEGEERQELKAAMAELDVPRGMSLIARTAGIGRSVEELQWDFNYLQQLWKAIEEAAAAHSEPYLLFMESALVIRAIRDYFRSDIGEILIDNPEVYQEVSEFMSYVMPNNVGRLKLYEDHTPLFSRFQIEHQIESAFSRSVSLPSGGAIVIDHTEALVSIDVNSARATRGADIEDTAFKTNMEAAEEVARQMRLRDLGGLVVIDFIDMENPKHQRDVENVLRDALKKDRARVQMGKLSRFGLLELSRQRLKPALGESSHIACPRCAGTGVIRSIESTALHVLRIIQEEAMKDNTGEVHAQVPVDVATFLLNEKRAELFGMEERLDVSVFLIPNIHLENPHYEITRVRNDDVDENAEPSYKRVAAPEEDEKAKPFGGEKAKAARPEPAVKGVKHTQPAPVVKEPSAGVWTAVASWFKGLFGGKKAEEPKEKRKPRQGSRRHNNRRQNQRRNARRPQQEAEELKNEQNRVQQDGERQERNERNDRRVRRQERNRSAEADHPAVEGRLKNEQETVGRDEKREEREVRENREPRRQRDRREQKAEHAAAAVQLPEAEVDAVAENGETAAENSRERQDRNERSRSRDRNDRNRSRNQRDRNRRNDKKRYIPSAEKIEHYLMIDEAAEKVRLAVAHVCGGVVQGQPSANLPEEPLNIILPVQNPVSEAAPSFSGLSDEQAVILSSSEKAVAAVARIMGVQQTGMVFGHAAGEKPERPEVEVGGCRETADEVVQAQGSIEESDETKLLQDSDADGLILVQTCAEAMARAAAQIQPEQPRGLRRSDVSSVVEIESEPPELVQVETKA
ncbi:MAG: Rne/Rng family ribonuclease [Neisseria sp.]|nr:Rne/Rng family ribonuclease [Neisseria sp.]